MNTKNTVPDLGQMRPCGSSVMRSLTWALQEVDPVDSQLYHYVWNRIYIVLDSRWHK